MKVKQDLGGQNSLVTPRLRRILFYFLIHQNAVVFLGKGRQQKTRRIINLLQKILLVTSLYPGLVVCVYTQYSNTMAKQNTSQC